jgi:hypothetical protein
MSRCEAFPRRSDVQNDTDFLFLAAHDEGGKHILAAYRHFLSERARDFPYDACMLSLAQNELRPDHA